MGYFANSTEGEIYESKYCNNCVHDDTMKEKLCPILLLHIDWNYEQFEETGESKRKKQILELFIPRGDFNGNGECVMFTEAKDDDFVDDWTKVVDGLPEKETKVDLIINGGLRLATLDTSGYPKSNEDRWWYSIPDGYTWEIDAAEYWRYHVPPQEVKGDE